MKRTLTILFLILATLGCQAQTGSYDELMAEAQTLFKQKEYAKSSECYEKAITLLKETGRDSLIPTVRNFVAINYLYMGVNAMDNKDFPTAKEHLEKALANAKPEGKAYYMIYSWMGQWHSVQSLNIRMENGDLQQAIELSLEAERNFDLAKAPEKRLREQISRANMLHSLLKNDEAESLLLQIVSECEGNTERNLLQGKALYTLGSIEMESERFQLALPHLEKGYNLCKADPTKDAQIYAQLLAQKLTNLYTSDIPDAEKAALWQQRTDELKNND